MSVVFPAQHDPGLILGFSRHVLEQGNMELLRTGPLGPRVRFWRMTHWKHRAGNQGHKHGGLVGPHLACVWSSSCRAAVPPGPH